MELRVKLDKKLKPDKLSLICHAPKAAWKAVVCSLVFFIGCHQQGKDHRTVFNLNLDQVLTSLDPAFARNNYAIWCDNQLYNGLLQLNDSLRVMPCIANRWTISDRGLTYTFFLRKDVYFNDDGAFANGKGRKVVAADFAYSFKRIVDKNIASSGAWIFNDKIEGGNAFRALSDSIFQIHLIKPFPPFLKLLTAQYCSVVPHEVADFYGKDFRQHPVGTGPFRFGYWKEDEVLVLLKNPHYFEQDRLGPLPHLDAVKISFIRDKQTAFLEFLKKNLDFFSNIDGSYRDDILTKTGKLQAKYAGKFVLVTGPNLDTEYLGVLVDSTKSIVRESPLRLKKVRQAIAYALDRKKMVTYLRNSLGIPGTAGFIPSGMPGFEQRELKGYTYDLAKAKRLMAEAGYPEGKNFPPITLNTITTYRDLTEYIQGQLEEAGIHVTILNNESASLREQLYKNRINFFLGNWVADYPDGENYLSLFYSKNKVPFGPNYTGFSNKKFDQLFEKSYLVQNDSARYAINRTMDHLVMEEAPIIVLYYDKVVNLYQNNISGLGLNALNLLNLKRVIKRNTF